VADDDPVNDQSIEFTFPAAEGQRQGAIAKYVVRIRSIPVRTFTKSSQRINTMMERPM
jgi:hypothetical protein